MKEAKLLQMALGTVGINTNEQTADLINVTIIKAKELGVEFSILDASKLQANIDKKYKTEKQ